MVEKIEPKHLREVIEILMAEKKLTRHKAWKLTKHVCKKYGLDDIPTNVQLLQACTPREKEKLRPILLTKPARTSSGVTTITVVPKPAPCPGDCVYCPQGHDAPKSYSGMEPAILRAKNNDYDPFKQVRNRIEQYEMMGHPTDKVQIIIIGGTFLALDKKYKESFIKRIYDALNKTESDTLAKAKSSNETATHRCVGLIIETRPDFCKQQHIEEMLGYGTTMVEIGVQSIYPEIIEKINRMHSLEDVKMATRLAKDAGLKVNYHIMTSLPGTTNSMDIDQFKIIFNDGQFKPDALKIYPTLVVKGTRLYDWWKEGKYNPATTEQTIEMLAESLNHIPKYCRIVRMQRTMAAGEIEAGVKKSNLREFVEDAAMKKGARINEIRYREIGRSKKVDTKNLQAAKLLRMDYDASGGREIFLSVEDVKNDLLIGFLRLRINGDAAIVRELHVYGPTVPIGEANDNAFQHRGFGLKLLAEAERIAKEEFKKKKITITSGIGVREYYYKNGYKLDGHYVSKKLK
jgi:elongator complex protein 3